MEIHKDFSKKVVADLDSRIMSLGAAMATGDSHAISARRADLASYWTDTLGPAMNFFMSEGILKDIYVEGALKDVALVSKMYLGHTSSPRLDSYAGIDVPAPLGDALRAPKLTTRAFDRALSSAYSYGTALRAAGVPLLPPGMEKKSA